MKYWLTENSTVPMITGAILVVILLFMAFSARDRILAMVAIGIGVLTFATVLCERIIVTHQEEVTETLYVLADHVANNNTAGILPYISKKHPEEATRAAFDMDQCNFESCRLIGTNSFVEPQSGNQQAEICFVVAASGVFKKYSHGPLAGNVKITLKLERESEANWKILKYTVEPPQAGLKL